MCKLCNTDRKPLIKTKYRFLEEVRDYLGENPCGHCISVVNKTYDRHPDMSIDYIILRKLYLVNRPFTYSQLGSLKQCQYNKYILGIKVIITSKSISYYPHINNSKKGVNVSFPVCNTLQKAIQIKYDYMVANGHTKGLAQLKNKLKELTNGNN